MIKKIKKLTIITGDKEVTLNGCQISRMLYALIKRPVRGVTSLDISTWALRTSSYIEQLRYRYGFEIETIMEPHDTGMHGRYFLRTPITIKEIQWAAK